MSQQEVSDHNLSYVYYYGAYPLWHYLKDVFNVDISEVCPRVAKDEPILSTSDGDLVPRSVDISNNEMLDDVYNNHVAFLVNSINVVFESLKSGIEREGVKILEPYKFMMDECRNLYLVNIETNQPVSRRAISVKLA